MDDKLREMAREVAAAAAREWLKSRVIYSEDSLVNVIDNALLAFAEKVAEEEREACAKVVDNLVDDMNGMRISYGLAHEISQRLRARGEKEGEG